MNNPTNNLPGDHDQNEGDEDGSRSDGVSSSSGHGSSSHQDASSSISSSTRRSNSTTTSSSKRSGGDMSSGGGSTGMGAGARFTRILGNAKIVVLVILLGLAVLTAWVWWTLATQYQQDHYRSVFEQYSTKVVDTFLQRIEYRIVAATSLATSLSIHNDNGGSGFSPISNFARTVESTRRLTQADTIWTAPWLTMVEERVAFEDHVASYATMRVTEDAAMTSTGYSYYKESNWQLQDGLYRFENMTAIALGNTSPPPYAPIWQVASSSQDQDNHLVLFDQQTEDLRANVLQQIHQTMMIQEGRPQPLFSASQIQATEDSLVNAYPDGPHVFLYAPILSVEDATTNTMAAALTLDLSWQSFWQGSIHGIPQPLTVLLHSSCGSTEEEEYTFQLGHDDDNNQDEDNVNTKFIQSGAHIFDSTLGLKLETSFEEFVDRLGVVDDEEEICQYRIGVYPTREMEEAYLTQRPLMSGIALGAIFVAVAMVFVCYDHFIQIRTKQVMQAATKSTAIIKSLFPANIRNKLLAEESAGQSKTKRYSHMLPEDYAMVETNKMRLQKYLMPSTAATGTAKSKKSSTAAIFNNPHATLVGGEPIAEFFSSVSVMHADLSGFTAWSSTREPAQVFTLLETLYGAMDKAAKRLGVFKVETIGDCYVAATGMPDPRADHAVILAKFANISISQIQDLTGTLEAQLGPGTGDLAFRIGIHSGPVTAGVLRGEKSRFQLFGDTVTVCSKIESAGRPGRIHISKTTADMLREHGKADWIERQTGDGIVAKGRGKIDTYWLKIQSSRKRESLMPSNLGLRSSIRDLGPMIDASSSHGDTEKAGPESKAVKRISSGVSTRVSLSSTESLGEKTDRLVQYNVEVMMGLLKKIVASRSVGGGDLDTSIRQAMENSTRSGSIALDEVKELISMPQYNEEAAIKLAASNYKVDISDKVRSELRQYIRRIAALYPENPFHNFEHASHVALSASKLLKRIVMPEEIDYRRSQNKESTIDKLLAVSKDLHQHTLGISSDPVAQFAVVFAALIHDVKHPGVPNGQLATEEPETAEKYRNQSIAEQRSIDIAWDILLEADFESLRSCMFPTASELKHFRELIVNMVMATDIFDKELGALRKARWQRCFHPDALVAMIPDTVADAFNRKATIVLEHIIQASDVAHTMQHWHVYIKWNSKLFMEMYRAFRQGRSTKDPTDGWYTGELWFFDNYVIPLAHKLKECGVFGVSSDEYLTYATENRNEWERKGQGVCQRLIEEYEETYGGSSSTE